ncbi:MAG: LURP-one-related/scramblase family protein, partial [Anaerolineae bacterium]
VKGRLISLRDRLSFQDLDGNELLHIKQKLVSLRPRYEIYRGDRHYATVAKRLLSLIGARFEISVEDGKDLTAKGNFLDYEYRFLRDDEEVAEVSKRWFALTDIYGVEIDDDVDDLLILASTVVIDMVNHNPDRED